MPNAPQGTFEFAGVFAEGEFQIARSGSTSPDTFTAQFLLGSNIPQYGAVRLSYGTRSVLLPDCRVVRSEIQGGTGGRYREVQFEDRRWRWKYAYAFGQINSQASYSSLPNYLPVDKAIRHLLSIVGDPDPLIFPPEALTQVDPVRYSNAKVWSNIFPQHWDGRTVADCLEELLSYYGLRLYLGWDNRVSIYVPGYGRDIPSDDRVMDYTFSVTPPVVPETLVFEFPNVTFVNDFVLTPVGYMWDTNTQNPSGLAPIENLNYGPIDPATNQINWALADPPLFNRITNKRIRELCRKTIFKLYRIDSSKRVSLLNPFQNQRIQGLGIAYDPEDFILDDTLVRVDPIAGGNAPTAPVKWKQVGVDADYQRLLFDEECDEFTLIGYFADRTLHQWNNNIPQVNAGYQLTGSEFINLDIATIRTQNPTVVYNSGFDFDAEERVFKLNDSLVFINRNQNGAVQAASYLPAKLIARVEHKLRRRADCETIRLVVPFTLNSPLAVPGLVEKIRIDDPLKFDRFGSTLESYATTAKLAGYFRNYVASKFSVESAMVPMKGFCFDIQPDGNTPTVALSRNSAGQCITAVQYLKENPVIFPIYDELTDRQRDASNRQIMKRNVKKNSAKLQAYLIRRGFP